MEQSNLPEFLANLDKLFLRLTDRMWKQHVWSKKYNPGNRSTIMGNGATDGSGNAAFPVGQGQIPNGEVFFVYRWIQWADPSTPGAPTTSSAGYATLTHGKNDGAVNIADFVPRTHGTTNQLFPNIQEYNSKAALEFRGESDIPWFHCYGGPATTNILVMLVGEFLTTRSIESARTVTGV